MKRILVAAMAALLSMSALSGCYGKFALTSKVYDVNGQVKDKFLRSGLTWILVIIPVYKVSFLVDFIVFNTIEFWSGSNPVAAGEKDFQYVNGDESFRIHARKSGDFVDYTIRHYNKGDLADITRIDWDTRSGRSVVTTDKNGVERKYLVSSDNDRIRMDQYSGGKIDDVVWFTPAGSLTGYLASAK